MCATEALEVTQIGTLKAACIGTLTPPFWNPEPLPSTDFFRWLGVSSDTGPLRSEQNFMLPRCFSSGCPRSASALDLVRARYHGPLQLPFSHRAGESCEAILIAGVQLGSATMRAVPSLMEASSWAPAFSNASHLQVATESSDHEGCAAEPV